MWDRPEVDFTDSRALPWVRVGEAEFGAGAGGALRKALSRDADDGARTELFSFSNPFDDAVDHSCDFYVLEGRGRIRGQEYAPGTYVHATSGSEMSWLPEVGRTVLYAGHNGRGRARTSSGTGVVTVKPWDRNEWVSMSWRGGETQLHDVHIRWLRRDDEGIVFLVGMLAGYEAPLQEQHTVYEESFKISGDLLLGRRGVVPPGGYFFRHPQSWHGPLYTRTGNLSIIRKNGHGDTQYRDAPDGESLTTLIPRMYDNGVAPAALAL